MTDFEVVLKVTTKHPAYFKQNAWRYIADNMHEVTVEKVKQASDLPEWDDLSDIDKAAVVWFLLACDSEGSEYAMENYPVSFVDNEVLTSLDPWDQLSYILDKWNDLEDLNLDFNEERRLYELYEEKR